jgi:hypothetical protein
VCELRSCVRSSNNGAYGFVALAKDKRPGVSLLSKYMDFGQPMAKFGWRELDPKVALCCDVKCVALLTSSGSTSSFVVAPCLGRRRHLCLWRGRGSPIAVCS